MPETPYSSLADLRGALSSDDASTRSDAYEVVLEADIRPDEVLSSDPPEEGLAEAGVIPRAGPNLPPAAEQREQMIDLLTQVVEGL